MGWQYTLSLRCKSNELCKKTLKQQSKVILKDKTFTYMVFWILWCVCMNVEVLCLWYKCFDAEWNIKFFWQAEKTFHRSFMGSMSVRWCSFQNFPGYIKSRRFLLLSSTQGIEKNSCRNKVSLERVLCGICACSVFLQAIHLYLDSVDNTFSETFSI